MRRETQVATRQPLNGIAGHPECLGDAYRKSIPNVLGSVLSAATACVPKEGAKSGFAPRRLEY